MTVEATTFQTLPLSPALGAEIRGLDLSRPLDGETVAALRAAWLEHLVLLFRGQTLDVEAQIRFAGYFGEPSEPRSGGGRDLDPHILLVTNIREDGKPIGVLPDGELQFHSDSAFLERPLMATVLYAVEIPDRGGETLFANTYRAFETLDPALKRRLEGRRAFNVYDYATQVKAGTLDRAGLPQAAHPVVRTHPETGRKALYVNRLMTEEILDMPPEDSAGAAGDAVRRYRAPGLRLRACLAEGRPRDLGQPLHPTRAARLSVRPDPADAPRRHRRRRAGVTGYGSSRQISGSPGKDAP